MEEMSKQMEEIKDMSAPFDIKKMAYGGFQVEVEKGKNGPSMA